MQTVTTSVDVDEFSSLPSESDLSRSDIQPPGSNPLSQIPDEIENEIGDGTRFAEYYRSITAEAKDVKANEPVLGDDTEFGNFYREQNAGTSDTGVASSGDHNSGDPFQYVEK